MTIYRWSDDKNREVEASRSVTFAKIVTAIETGGVLNDHPHPNSEKYPNQWMMVVAYKQYAYLVPYVIEDEDRVFLKTIIPSRKATRDYLRPMNDKETDDDE
ncbi:toxin [Nesterenkonia alkaliphila]|uniref:toxin n=1 Tax=Nesterenkonia alkaliphila TaxID=1463631 RepID=UPI001665F67B|nr:toxin [Nesterenkonia alkaliphila]